MTIIPEDLTLEEFIGVLKAKDKTELAEGDLQSNSHTSELLNIMQIIKRELDKKEDK